ncbi:MAG: DUF1343 domain-containing protein [Limnochordia bacterium]|nr:DUF1343 domain-containing protein [Limnochordia bacterium]
MERYDTMNNACITQRVRLGVDVFLNAAHRKYKGARLGLITNQCGQTSSLIPTVEALYHHKEVNLVALFGPEHGVRGDAQAGIRLANGVDPVTGLPVYSLYGDTRKPSAKALEGIDALVFDIPDGGVRFLTYSSTLSYVMEAAAEHGIKVIVCDRPNPIRGDRVEGNVLDPTFRSFVGCHPIAMRHGMTMGELAWLMNEHFGIGCRLEVIRMEGWRREHWYDETGAFWVMLGPNIPTLMAATVYPGTCLVEGTNVSEGRGTTCPFELIGAPWIDAGRLCAALRELSLPGLALRQAHFTPTFSKYKGEGCHGVQIYVTDRDVFRPIGFALHLISTIKRLFPQDFQWRGKTEPLHFDLLWGTDIVRHRLDDGESVDSILSSFQPGIDRFLAVRENYLLYPALEND